MPWFLKSKNSKKLIYPKLFWCVCLLTLISQTGCVINSQRGSMASWRLSFNEHQRLSIISERIEARPPRREQVNYYRWQHSELLTDSTPVSQSTLTRVQPASYEQGNQYAVDPFAESTKISPPVDPEIVEPDIKAPMPDKTESRGTIELPPPVWDQSQEAQQSQPQLQESIRPQPPAPSLPESSPEVNRLDTSEHVAGTRIRSFFQTVGFQKSTSPKVK